MFRNGIPDDQPLDPHGIPCPNIGPVSRRPRPPCGPHGLRAACPGRSDELSQFLHLAGEEVALWRSPGPVTERLMLHDLDQSSRLAVHRKRDGRSCAGRWLSWRSCSFRTAFVAVQQPNGERGQQMLAVLSLEGTDLDVVKARASATLQRFRHDVDGPVRFPQTEGPDFRDRPARSGPDVGRGASYDNPIGHGRGEVAGCRLRSVTHGDECL